MSDEDVALASVEQVRAMTDGAHDMLLDAIREPWDAPERPASDRLPLAFAALRFCAYAARELGDASLYESIADAFSLRVELEDDFPDDDEALLGEATAELLALQPRLSERTIELSADASPDVRRAIAQGLRPAVPGAPALLRKLATDLDPRVREAARASLGDTAETPWWTGMLSADPAGVVGETEAARLRPALEQVLARLNVLAVAEIAPLAQALPPELAADVAAHALAHVDYTTEKCVAPLAKLVLAAPSADGALDRLVTQWAELGRAITVRKPVAAQIAALPAKRRAACCRRLAERALAAPEAERLLADSAATLAGNLAGDAWPEKLDYGFVLDAVDALEREDASDTDSAVVALCGLFDQAAPRAAHVPRLVARMTAPPSESWREVTWWIGKHLAKLERDELRPIAERAAACREDDVVRWGLEQLASKAWKKGDPEVHELLRAWVADARLWSRVAHSHDLRASALPFLRERLRAGELDLEAAVQTVLTATMRHDEGRGVPPPPAIATDEWAAYRAIRDRAPIDDAYPWFYVLQAFPAGPRHPADRALIGRAIEATRQERALVHSLCHVLGATPDAKSLADATALLAVVQGDDRDRVQDLREKLANQLGVPVPPEMVPGGPVGSETPPAPSPPPARGLEWMDEPDE